MKINLMWLWLGFILHFIITIVMYFENVEFNQINEFLYFTLPFWFFVLGNVFDNVFSQGDDKE